MVFLNYTVDNGHIEVWAWKRDTEHRVLVVNRRSDTSNIKVDMGTNQDYGTYSGVLPSYGVIGFWIDVKYTTGTIWVYKDNNLILCGEGINWYIGDS